MERRAKAHGFREVIANGGCFVLTPRRLERRSLMAPTITKAASQHDDEARISAVDKRPFEFFEQQLRSVLIFLQDIFQTPEAADN